MPFIPPIIGAALIGGGAGLGSTLISKHGQQSIANQQQQMATQAAQRSQPAYDQAYKYYSGILNGGPQMMQSLAPSINNINATYDQTYKNVVGSAYSRGGALDKALRSVQTGKAFSLADLYGNAQSAGAQGLAGLASGDASSAARLLGDANASKTANQMANTQALSGIGGLITRLFATPGLFGGGGGSNETQDTFAARGINNPFAAPSAIQTPTFNQMMGV